MDNYNAISFVVYVATEYFAHPFMMMIYGLLTHFLKAFAQIKHNTGKNICFYNYYSDNPSQTILCFVGALAGYALLDGTQELTKASAFMMGFLADSAVDVIGQRSGVNKHE